MLACCFDVQIEFMAEDEMVEIVPNLRMDSLNFICVMPPSLPLLHAQKYLYAFFFSSILFGLIFLFVIYWFGVMAGGLWTILSTIGSSSAALVSSGFEEEREMHNQASSVDVNWCVLDRGDISFPLFFQSDAAIYSSVISG